MPESGCCNPITARSRLDLPEPEGPTRLTNWPGSTARLDAFEDRLPAIGDRQIADAQLSASDDRRVVQPGDARAGLDQAAGDQALLDALGGVEIDVTVSG